MAYWKGLGKYLWKILGGMLLLLGVFEWGVKLKVSKWVIPDWIFLVILVLIVAVLGYTAYFVGKYPKAGEFRKPKKVEIQLDQDGKFIITALAHCKDRTIEWEPLRGLFLKENQDKTDGDFNIVMNSLTKQGLIDTSFGFSGGKYVTIMPAGLEYYTKLRDANKK